MNLIEVIRAGQHLTRTEAEPVFGAGIGAGRGDGRENGYGAGHGYGDVGGYIHGRGDGRGSGFGNQFGCGPGGAAGFLLSDAPVVDHPFWVIL